MEESNTYVIDSSYTLAYLLPDEDVLEVQQFFNRLKVQGSKLISSPLLFFEVFNGLKTAIMRKRIKANLAKELGRKFLQIPIELLEIDFVKVLAMADKYNLTFYDAIYLYSSKSQHIPLLTLDTKLKDLF